MKYYLFLLVFFVYLFLSPATQASGGNAGRTATTAFRINQATVELRFEPPFSTPDSSPMVILRLSDPETGTAIIDADLYLLLENGKLKPDAHATGHSQRLLPDDVSMEGMALDFGDSPPARRGTDLSNFQKLVPRTIAGEYVAPFPFDRPGDYRFTLAVKSLSSLGFSEPLLYGGELHYQAESKASLYRIFFGMTVLLLSGFAAFFLAAGSISHKPPKGEKRNLLDFPRLKRFIRSRWFQPAFQIPTLLVFIAIVYLGLSDTQAGDLNIATILTWTIWWAAVIFSFVLVGRVWCMMCPFGACQDWLGRVGLKKNFPRPLRNIWLSTFLFIGLTWWDSYSGIVNNPAFTSWLLIVFTLVSATTALVYKGRAFCRFICPIGGLIGIYSMVSPVELRNRSLQTCRTDRTKGCIHGTSNSSPCPMFETPMTLERNNYCNLCGECVKSCGRDNIVLRIRGFARDLWVSTRGRLDEAYLIMVLVGLTALATAEMIEPWHRWTDRLVETLPLAAFGLNSHAAQEEFIYALLLIAVALLLPSLALLLAGLAVKSLTGWRTTKVSAGKIFIDFSYMFIPVGLSMHLAHNLSHLLREGVQIVPALQRVLTGFAGLGPGEPGWNVAPLVGVEAMFWLQLLTIIVLNGYSLYAGYRIARRLFPEKALRAFVPMVALTVAFMLVNTYVLGQPMALRHVH